MNKEYIKINKNAYEILANEYNTRNYEIGYDFWNNIYDDLNLKNKNNDIQEQNDTLNNENTILKSEINHIYNSKSWKIL